MKLRNPLADCSNCSRLCYTFPCLEVLCYTFPWLKFCLTTSPRLSASVEDSLLHPLSSSIARLIMSSNEPHPSLLCMNHDLLSVNAKIPANRISSLYRLLQSFSWILQALYLTCYSYLCITCNGVCKHSVTTSFVVLHL